ncbi:MAG: curli assembly protein CsgF, partial [Nitrososphaeraceae archaeon]|nr:curli assembly protein CsgF [Nitrososphaeraceae archaeon]
MYKLLKFFFLSAIFCFFLLANDTFAQQLVYTPVNPSFGGSPLNGSWLISSAQLQDTNTDPNAASQQTDPLQNFKDQL